VEAADILFQNCSAYEQVGPTFRVVSPLAEGSDRLVAEEALAMGFQLQSPLPFSREEYKNDFETEVSKKEFDELIKKARPVFELDGSRSTAESAYEAVGRVVLRQSDLLIAIWDGAGPKGRGGTGQIVREALLRKVPAVWINAFPPHKITLLSQISDDGRASAWSGLDDTVAAGEPKPKDERRMTRWLRKILRRKDPDKTPPSGAFDGRLKEILALPSTKELRALAAFRNERQRRIPMAIWYRLFCTLFVWTNWRVFRLIETFEGPARNSRDAWKSLPEPNRSVGQQIDHRFGASFRWADGLAEIYADRYRSSFILTYGLGALAVFAAFLGSHSPQLPQWLGLLREEHIWFKVEFTLILSILLLVIWNKWGHWHERWIDYRLLAEGLRQMMALAPFAYVTPAFEVPAHLGEENHGPTWFNWYFRALVRQAGLVEATIGGKYLAVCRCFLMKEVRGQVNYHRTNEHKLEALHHRLHGLSICLFFLTLVACVLHIAGNSSIEHLLGENTEDLLTLFAIVLPAFGAAIQGIVHQGEFGRIGRRSRSIKNRLQSMAEQVGDAKQTQSFNDLGRATESFCEIQLLEQADWRSVFISKEVSLP